MNGSDGVNNSTAHNYSFVHCMRLCAARIVYDKGKSLDRVEIEMVLLQKIALMARINSSNWTENGNGSARF